MSRTLLKTATYSVMHFAVAIIVAYALTRDWRLALAVGVVEPLVQTVAFAIHEKLWSRAPGVRSLPFCGHGHDFPPGQATSAQGASYAVPAGTRVQRHD
jgi:uncharacterized membrane protein